MLFLMEEKKPIFDCDYYGNFRRKRMLYTLIRVRKKKSDIEILSEKIEKLEKLIEEMYNSDSKN